MALIRAEDRLAADLRKPQGAFTGDADQRTVHAREEPSAVRVSFVRFAPGTTTHWHSHSGGQVLHAVDGEGRAQVRGEAIITLHPGDTLVAAAAEEHWHGAAPGTGLTHLAVTIGEVTWREPPSD